MKTIKAFAFLVNKKNLKNCKGFPGRAYKKEGIWYFVPDKLPEKTERVEIAKRSEFQ